MSKVIEEEISEVELDIQKVYKFPKEISIREVDGAYLVIFTKGCNWLALNHDELFVFKELQAGKSIEEVLAHYEESTVISVLAQIEAKKFEDTSIREKNIHNIYIYLTNNCNLRCKHCYMYSGDIKIEELDLQQWKKIILDFKNCGGNGITFTGGEISVYKGFEDLIKYTHNLGIQVTILTNGILWDKKQIHTLYSYIDEIQISIDGYDRDSYYEVRQFDGFDKACETIKEFHNLGVRVSMAVTPLYDKMSDFVKEFEKFGKQFLIDNPGVNIKINMELLDGRTVKNDSDKNKEYNAALKKLTERLYPDYFKKNFIFNFADKTLQKNCGFGEISIASNGDIYWCNRIFELRKFLNIKDISFSELLKKSEYIKSITDVDHSAVCSKCDIRYICGGGCRLKYPNINNADKSYNLWKNVCPEGRREHLYRKMIESNEFFYE